MLYFLVSNTINNKEIFTYLKRLLLERFSVRYQRTLYALLITNTTLAGYVTYPKNRGACYIVKSQSSITVKSQVLNFNPNKQDVSHFVKRKKNIYLHFNTKENTR